VGVLCRGAVVAVRGAGEGGGAGWPNTESVDWLVGLKGGACKS